MDFPTGPGVAASPTLSFPCLLAKTVVMWKKRFISVHIWYFQLIQRVIECHRYCSWKAMPIGYSYSHSYIDAIRVNATGILKHPSFPSRKSEVRHQLEHGELSEIYAWNAKSLCLAVPMSGSCRICVTQM